MRAVSMLAENQAQRATNILPLRPQPVAGASIVRTVSRSDDN